MAPTWQLMTNSLPSQLSQKDGVNGCVLNGKMYAMGGWRLSDGARFNSVSYSTDGITWTQSAKTASWTPRHCTPVVAHDGRIFVLGGDTNSGAYMPNVHSWSGLETDDWVVETTTAPWGNRTGHIAFSYGGYLWVGFGQTMTTLTAAPTQFFTDLWRSPTGLGDSWTLFEDKAVCGYRPFISSQPALLDGDLYFIGGGTYETTDFPGMGNRELKNDVWVMKPDFSFELVNHGKGSALTKRMFHCIAALGDDLYVLAGWAGGDLANWYKSTDKGITWTLQATPPWAARHAAMVIPFNDALYFGTGQYATDMWRLMEPPPPPAGLHMGALPDGTSNVNPAGTMLDKSTVLIAGKTVTEIGYNRQSSGSMTPKIVKQIGTSNVFDIVWSGSAVTHPGGGHVSFPITPFVVPSDGSTYRIGWYFGYTTQEPYSYAGNVAEGMTGRWYKTGNATGTGQTFGYYGDGSCCMGWQELV